MKILITGAKGQVGWELARAAQPLGEVIALDRSHADLADPEGLRRLVRRLRPDVILNAAAYTAVDKAEGAGELLVSVPIGHRFPPDAPAQMRVRLAWASAEIRERELARWRPVRYTPTTIIDPKLQLRQIELARQRGYAISRAEFTPGVTTLAVPVFDRDGRVVRILQCPGLDADVPSREWEVAEPLMQVAELIGSMIGASAV